MKYILFEPYIFFLTEKLLIQVQSSNQAQLGPIGSLSIISKM